MGSTQSREPDPKTISEALWVLGRKEESAEGKQTAFKLLRDHFCRKLSANERQRAVSSVSAERHELWSVPPCNASTLSPARLADRIRGLVFGAAFGDATGLATEFLSRDDANSFYGPDFNFCPSPEFTHPDRHRMVWLPGDWTDDTDQLVLMLQSLLHSGGAANSQDFALRLHTWAQNGFPELGDESAVGMGASTKAVLQDASFLASPETAARKQWASRNGVVASNGAVMRTAISGVPHFYDRERVLETTGALCRVTHADPRCAASCAAVAVCVSELLRSEVTDFGALVATAVEAAVGVLHRQVEVSGAAQVWTGSSTSAAVAESELRRYASVGTLRELELDEQKLPSIGYTYKCLGAGLWAVRSNLSFEATMSAITAEAGDADTNGAVAGALLGCRLGFSQLPSAWVTMLPHAEWLEAHVKKLLIMMHLDPERS